MSFLKKFQRSRKSSESGSIGSTLSIQSIGTNKGLLNTTYSVNEKELPSFLKAIWRNDIAKVKKLMKKNYSIVDKEQRSGLHLACAMGSEPLVRELLGNYGNELLEKKDNNGRTALFKAVEAGALECVRLLMEKGAKIDIRDNNGETLIHAAVKYKHVETLQYLLGTRCNADVMNNEGLRPLHLASSSGFISGIDVLIEHNVDVNQLTLSGKSSLIMAAESGNYNVVKELLSRNADINICDNDGKNAYYYADYHEYTDCANQIQSVGNFSKTKTPPKKATPLQMPEFIASQSSISHPLTNPILRNQNSKDDLKMSHENKQDSKKNSGEKLKRNGSITSGNSWSGDFSHYSSDTTLPNLKSHNIHDISTPSSMPNPSDNASDHHRPLSIGISKIGVTKQLSEDEESQWTDTDPYNDPVPVISNHKVKSTIETKATPEIKVGTVDKNGDSDWDSDSDAEKHNADGNLSTIDEESALRKTNNNSSQYSPLTKMNNLKIPVSDDGHQTDSNIEECFYNNYAVLNKPVRYDSDDALEKSMDDDDDNTELSQTKIPNPNFKEDIPAPFSKPPVSPMPKTDTTPVMTIDDVSIRRNVTKNAGGDNLSYSSTDMSSRRESLAGSDIHADIDRSGSKLLDQYIKRCSDLESKLRTMESEKEIFQQDNKRLTEAKIKLESEKLKFQKDFQKSEVSLSDKKDELDEFKSKFIISEDLLKTREKELFEAKKANQDMAGHLSDIELKNIAYDSKIKQLQQEVTSLQSELQRSAHSEKDVESHKTQYETEQNAWRKKNEELTGQLADLQNQIGQSKLDSEKIIAEQRVSIENYLSQITELKETMDDKKEDEINRMEEIEQLKKTIKNLNADLESSNKSASLVAKEEQKNKNLSEKLKIEENKVEELRKTIEVLQKQISETDKSHSSTKQEIARLKNELNIKDNNLSQVELKYVSSENKAKELEKLLEAKIKDAKELNKKCIEADEGLLAERNKNDSIIERVNSAINSAITQCPGSEEVLEQLQNIRQSLTGSGVTQLTNHTQSSPSYKDLDSSIELSKAKSQIRVLQDELENARRDLQQTQDNVIVPRNEIQFQSSGSMNRNYERELNRIDRIERIEKENQQESNEQARVLRKNQQQMEMSELNQMLSNVEKDRDELIQEIKTITEQLQRERHLKDSLTEQLMNIMKTPNGSVQPTGGDFMFPSTAALNSASSQWNILNNASENDRRPFSTSMSNLSLLKSTVPNDDELRQRMRKELDRSIAKHLESGRPIRQLNVKDKIRSLNLVRVSYSPNRSSVIL